jgi:hypothetical protein
MTTVKIEAICLAALALFFATVGAIAQEAEAPQVYQVELILFRHADQSRTTSEIPRMPEPEIADILEQDLPRIEAADPYTTSYENMGEVIPFWQLLDSDQLRLNGISNRVNSLGAYELLAHVGWLQKAPDAADAEEIVLLDLGIGQEQAIGSIKLLQRRYLHLAVDVTLVSGNRDTFSVFSASKTAPAINESRRMRLEDLVYFDQPKFGIIAMVARSDATLEQPPLASRQ